MLTGQVGFKAALKDLREGNRVTYDVAYQARCPYLGHRGSCDFHYLFEAGPHDGSTAGAVGVLSGPNQLRVTTSGSTQGAPTRVQDVLRCLDGVEYLHLPPVLSRDLDFLDRAGQANCLLAAAALLREARRLKVAARSSFGLLLVPPYAGVHTWVEFQVDDQWVAFDPHLIRLMEKAGVLSPGQWPETSSLSGMLLRWAAINQATGRHGPNHAEVSYALKKVT